MTAEQIIHINELKQKGNLDPIDISWIWERHLEYFQLYPNNKNCASCVREAFNKVYSKMQEEQSAPGNI